MIAGKSSEVEARKAYCPMPGHAKILSVSTAPASSPPYEKPITVTTGMSALRRAWRSTTVRSRKPLAWAVRT